MQLFVPVSRAGPIDLVHPLPHLVPICPTEEEAFTWSETAPSECSVSVLQRLSWEPGTCENSILASSPRCPDYTSHLGPAPLCQCGPTVQLCIVSRQALHWQWHLHGAVMLPPISRKQRGSDVLLLLSRAGLSWDRLGCLPWLISASQAVV